MTHEPLFINFWRLPLPLSYLTPVITLVNIYPSQLDGCRIRTASSKLIRMVKDGHNPPSDWPTFGIRPHKLVSRLLLDRELYQKTTMEHTNVNLLQQLIEGSPTDATWHVEGLGKRKAYIIVLSNCALEKGTNSFDTVH